MEYGPSVTKLSVLQPAIYKEHHNRPNEAIPTKIIPMKNKIVLKKGALISQALLDTVIVPINIMTNI